jgi:hypothetical protein
MHPWQAAVIGISFVYLILAMGLYGFATMKVQPFLGMLPPEVTITYVRLIFLVASFGWPLIVAALIYIRIIDGMMELAGIKWENIIGFDQIKMGFVNKAKNKEIDGDQLVEELKANKLADRVTAVYITMLKDGDRFTFATDEKSTIAQMLAEPTSFGHMLQSFCMPAFRDTDEEPQDVEATDDEDNHG